MAAVLIIGRLRVCDVERDRSRNRGRACTPKFAWWAARDWWEIYTVLGFEYMLPVVATVGALTYAGMDRLSSLQRPVIFFFTATALILITFTLAALFTAPNGQCVWP